MHRMEYPGRYGGTSSSPSREHGRAISPPRPFQDRASPSQMMSPQQPPAHGHSGALCDSDPPPHGSLVTTRQKSAVLASATKLKPCCEIPMAYGRGDDADLKPDFVSMDTSVLRRRAPRNEPKEIMGSAAAAGLGAAAGLEWIIHFREEMDRFAQDNIGRGIRIKYPYVVPTQMKALKASAYSPQSHIYLGLNFRPNASQEDKNMTRLKANWANNYIRWRMRQGINANVATDDRGNNVNLTAISETGPGHAHSWTPESVPDITGSVAVADHDHSEASHPSDQSTGWDDFVRALDIDVGAAVECYELGFHYVPAQHRKQLKEMLAADALFLVIYLLYVSGDLPERGFGWLVNDPQFRAANSHYFLQDFFLLENQIPLRVVEAVVQDFCWFRNLGKKGLGLDRKNLMEKLVLAVVNRRIKMLFPSLPSLKIVYVWGSHWQANANAAEPMTKLVKEQGAVDIGLCDHLLDCLLQAICSPHEPAVSFGIRTWEQFSDDGTQDTCTKSTSTPNLQSPPLKAHGPERLVSNWAQSQGWGFMYDPGNFSNICRMKPKGDHWYDVTKLLPSHKKLMNGPGAVHLKRELSPSVGHFKRKLKEALIKSMTVRVGSDDQQAFLRAPPDIRKLHDMTVQLADSVGIKIKDANNPADTKKLYDMIVQLGDSLESLQAPSVLVQLDLRPTVSHMADYVRECIASEPTVTAEEFRKQLTLNQFISELLIAVSEASRENDGRPAWKAKLLGHNIHKVREQLVRALRQVDRDLRPTSGLGIDPCWERITAYGYTFSYFAETAALLKALDRAVVYSLNDMRIEVKEVLLHTDNGVLLELALEGLVARGYAITNAVESCAGLSEGTKILLGAKLKKTHAAQSRISSKAQKPKQADAEDLKAESVESATRLKRVGITLDVCDRVEHIELQMVPTAVLKLPKLTIDDGADSLFRNLSVWERIKMADRVTPFACYIKLLDNLIDTAEDVALMRQAGVIVHHLGSDAAVATMVNDLAVGLSFYTSQKWAKMLRQLNVRTKNKGKQYWAEFVDNYFSRPWHTTATLAATFLLLFAAAQTILTAVQL